MSTLLRVRHALAVLILLVCVSRVGAQGTEAGAAEEPSIRKGKVLLGSYFNFSLSTLEKTRVNRGKTTSDIVDVGINVTTGKMLSDKWGIILIGGYAQTSAVTPIPNTLLTFGEFSKATLWPQERGIMPWSARRLTFSSRGDFSSAVETPPPMSLTGHRS